MVTVTGYRGRAVTGYRGRESDREPDAVAVIPLPLPVSVPTTVTGQGDRPRSPKCGHGRRSPADGGLRSMPVVPRLDGQRVHVVISPADESATLPRDDQVHWWDERAR